MHPEYRHGSSDYPQNRKGRFVPVDEIPDNRFLDPEQALLAKEAGEDDEPQMTVAERDALQRLREKEKNEMAERDALERLREGERGAGFRHSPTRQSSAVVEGVSVGVVGKKGMSESGLRVMKSPRNRHRDGGHGAQKSPHKDHRPRGSSSL